uniref:AAA family ATPase n=1 Tax=Anaerovibrio sp. TaxID=1872532 RepID=UPI0025E82280
MSKSNSKKDDLMKLSEKSQELYKALCSKISGQDEAIHYFVKSLFNGQFMPLTDKTKLINVFLLAGMQGAGKTTLAQVTAEKLQRRLIEIDLADNTKEKAADALINPIKDKDDSSKITRFVEKDPNGILLLKNIDKASKDVIDALGKIIEQGHVTDTESHKDISFADTIIIFTTRLGSELYLADKYSAVVKKAVATKTLCEELAEEENPVTFFNDFFSEDHIIFFRKPPVSVLLDKIGDSFTDFAHGLKENFGYDLEIGPNVASLCLYGHSNDVSVDTADGIGISFLKNELYDLSRHFGMENMGRLEKIVFQVELPPEGVELFSFSRKPQIVVVGDKKSYPSLVENEHVEYLFAEDIDELEGILSDGNNYVSLVLIDLLYGMGFEQGQFGIENEAPVGLSAYEIFQKYLPDDYMVYTVYDGKISASDYFSFVHWNARGSVDLNQDSTVVLADMERLSRTAFVQKTYDDLQNRGWLISHKTTQSLSKDGKIAVVTFYDFGTEQLKPMPIDDYLEEETAEVYFDDIVGADSAKEELRNLSEYLRAPNLFKMKYGSDPGGIMLFGEQDTGKVSLGKALAYETPAHLLFLSSSRADALASDDSSELLKNLFQKAINQTPSVILIGQLDDFLKKIGSDGINVIINGIKDIRERGAAVLFVGTVNCDAPFVDNRNSDIDPDLLRLIEYKIQIKIPDRDERIHGIRRSLARKGIDNISDTLIENIADRIRGWSIADIDELTSLAKRKAVRQEKEVNQDILSDALDELVHGYKTDLVERDYYATAVHEAGHAYLQYYVGEKSSYITIIARENYGGYTKFYTNEKEDVKDTRQRGLNYIKTYLAGRA